MKKISVIIGASRGIGSQVARVIAQKGISLHLIARDENRLKIIGDELSANYSAIDASNFDSLEAQFSELSGSGMQINSVINCAGSVILKPAHMTSQAEFEDMISKNLATAFSAVRPAGKFVRNGSVVLCSSAAVRVGLQNHEAVAAAKGGIEGLVRSAAATYASKGVRVNAVAPGLTRTPMTKKITDNPVSLKISTEMHALGRIGKTEDIASAISWLADESQSWVTGQVIAVDGGLSTVVPRAR